MPSSELLETAEKEGLAEEVDPELLSNLEEAVEFHGHWCGGITMGVRMATKAMEELGVDRPGDEELVAFVETDSCVADGVQSITGCTFGKGNLVYENYGKMAFTLYDREEGEAVRVNVGGKWRDRSREIRSRMEEIEAEEGLEPKEAFQEAMKENRGGESDLKLQLLRTSGKDLLEAERVNVDEPDRASIYPSVLCDDCGEPVMEPRAQLQYGEKLCGHCADGGYYSAA